MLRTFGPKLVITLLVKSKVNMFSFQIFVGSRRVLVANSIHTADADATQLDS